MQSFICRCARQPHTTQLLADMTVIQNYSCHIRWLPNGVNGIMTQTKSRLLGLFSQPKNMDAESRKLHLAKGFMQARRSVETFY